MKKLLSLKTVFKKLQEKEFPLRGGGRDDMIQAGGVLTSEQYEILEQNIRDILKAIELKSA